MSVGPGPVGCSANPAVEALRKGLEEHGWSIGQNVSFERRCFQGVDELAQIMQDVAPRVDLIVAWTTPAAAAAKRVTSQVPVVFLATADPVGLGLVSQLARPGGNLTGVSFDVAPTMYAKNLQLLQEAVPSLRRVAVLIADPRGPESKRMFVDAARGLGLEPYEINVEGPRDLEVAVQKSKAQGAQAVYIWPSGLTHSFAKELARLAVANQLPSFHAFREGAIAGGLLSHAPSLTDIGRRGAMYIGKILRGAKPADLPLLRADQVIDE